MRFWMVLLGAMGVLGCAVESQAGPIDLFGLRTASHAASRHSSFSMRDEFAALGHLGSAAPSLNWYQAVLFGADSTPDSLILDDRSRVPSAGTSESAQPDRMPQLKWRTDQCEDGPCPTTVPEPTTMMLLAIGSGLAAVSPRLRRRK